MRIVTVTYRIPSGRAYRKCEALKSGICKLYEERLKCSYGRNAKREFSTTYWKCSECLAEDKV